MTNNGYPIFFIYDISLDECRRSMSIFSKSIRKKILTKHLNIKPEFLRFSKGRHGKPILKGRNDFHFNISHSNNYWMMALSKDGEIGIDIEFHKDRKNMDDIVTSYFHSSEREEYNNQKSDTEKKVFFYHIWTRKEAYAKYLGMGLNYNFSSSDFTNNNVPTVPISTTLITNTKGYHFTSVSIAYKNLLKKIRIFGNTPLKKLSFF